MLKNVTSLLPAALLGGCIYFHDATSLSLVRRFMCWSCITGCAIHVIISGSPYVNPLMNYISGFMASWYIIWAANILLVQDVKSLRRIQARHSGGYVWEALPKKHGYQRLLWALDLTFNFRAIGWNYSKRPERHPLVEESQDSSKDAGSPPMRKTPAELGGSRSTFLPDQLRQFGSAWLWLFWLYPRLMQSTDSMGGGSVLGVLLKLFTVATTLFMFMDGIHSLAGFVAVALLSGESWAYPPFFGPSRFLLSGRLQDIWGNFWHDLLKEGLLSVATALLPRSLPRGLYSLVRIWMCFCLTGVVHTAASYTTSQEWMPSLYAGIFYCLQPVGILIQLVLSLGLRKLLPASLVWMYYCFPWVSGDPALRDVIAAVCLM
ncbi:hypothetical protein BDV34DRAFT_220211 [Aspergillus parasiticus]|uniref:Wax synthase domain-containing protein n=1 Tax=Aspergillus parasiticus TaxID=5067 RepID=A0A5N6E0L1_ASPPA|nr:hypothetical protein BDV34DRAFT_220211 [Aspergillus parasiticus]